MSRDTTVIPFRQPEAIDDPLSELAREGARRMLAQVLIAEADSFVPDGRDRVVRHGHGPHRAIQTGLGAVEVRRAKVRDRGDVGAEEKIRNKAVACLTKDREALLAFFDFPAEHWDHLRTSNPIESVFATVRHRTVRTRGALSAKTAKLMVFKLVNAAAKTWRRLKGENQLPKVVQGVKFQNGIEVIELPAHHAA